jgi:hypothetical protein
VLHAEMRLSPERVSCVVMACAVLHNLAIELNEPDCGAEPAEDEPEPQLVGAVGDGKRTREYITRTYFA